MTLQVESCFKIPYSGIAWYNIYKKNNNNNALLLLIAHSY